MVARYGMINGRCPKSFLRLAITIIDKQETAAVEPVALQTIDDASESIYFLKKNRDVIHQKAFAIVKEGCQDRSKFFPSDFPTSIFVLDDV